MSTTTDARPGLLGRPGAEAGEDLTLNPLRDRLAGLGRPPTPTDVA
jgi:hypothetical protein